MRADAVHAEVAAPAVVRAPNSSQVAAFEVHTPHGPSVGVRRVQQNAVAVADG
jgi:hypothetical protein